MAKTIKTEKRNTGILSEPKAELKICNTCNNYMSCMCSETLKNVSYRHTCINWSEKIVHYAVQLKY